MFEVIGMILGWKDELEVPDFKRIITFTKTLRANKGGRNWLSKFFCHKLMGCRIVESFLLIGSFFMIFSDKEEGYSI